MAHEFDLSEHARAGLRRFNPHALLTPYPDCMRAVRRARACGHRIGVLSNFSLLDLDRSLVSLGVSAYVDAARSAAQIGCSKPTPEAYQAIARALGVDATDCVFVDNRQEHVEGAARIGMRAYLLCRNDAVLTSSGLGTLDALPL